MTILVAILCFCLGFLTASWIFYCNVKRREQERKEMQEKRRASKSPVTQPEPWNQPKASVAPVKRAASSVPQKVPAVPPPENTPQRQSLAGGRQSTVRQTVDQVFAKFETVENLKLNFSYLAPDDGSSYFAQGEGYVRNARNELLPDQEAFRCINTSTSYAKSGLFWAFDVSYRGELYTFQQLLNGAIGSGYVRICGIKCPAVVQKQPGLSCYTLLRKGQLEIVDQ